MPLKLRPTDLGSEIDKDRPDYTVVTGEWEVSRIYQARGGPANLRWFWSMTVNGPMTRSNRVATPRRGFRRAGTIGRRGRTWRRCPNSANVTGTASLAGTVQAVFAPGSYLIRCVIRRKSATDSDAIRPPIRGRAASFPVPSERAFVE
jgi:hypothetical protein